MVSKWVLSLTYKWGILGVKPLMDSPLILTIQVGGARDIKLENIMLARVRRGDIFVPWIFFLMFF